jgi:hypothetical protein
MAEDPASPAQRVLSRRAADLLAIDGVQGIGLGRTPGGEEAIVVHLLDASVASTLPARLDSVPVVTAATGPINPQKHP